MKRTRICTTFVALAYCCVIAVGYLFTGCRDQISDSIVSMETFEKKLNGSIGIDKNYSALKAHAGDAKYYFYRAGGGQVPTRMQATWHFVKRTDFDSAAAIVDSFSLLKELHGVDENNAKSFEDNWITQPQIKLVTGEYRSPSYADRVLILNQTLEHSSVIVICRDLQEIVWVVDFE